MSVRNWIAEAGDSGALQFPWDAGAPSTPAASMAETATPPPLSRLKTEENLAGKEQEQERRGRAMIAEEEAPGEARKRRGRDSGRGMRWCQAVKEAAARGVRSRNAAPTGSPIAGARAPPRSPSLPLLCPALRLPIALRCCCPALSIPVKAEAEREREKESNREREKESNRESIN
jgi:hypothetical protein